MFSSNLDRENSTADAYSRIYTLINATGENRLLLSQQLSDFNLLFEKMVLSDTLHYGSIVRDITVIMTGIINFNTKIANSEIRCSDDLRDVVERFKVVERISKEQFAAMKDVDESTRRLIEAEKKKFDFNNSPNNNNTPNSDAMLIKLNGQIEQAREYKKNCLIKAKSATVDLIDAQERYNVFKLKRQIHAWKAFAAAMRSNYTKLAQLFEQLAEAVVMLRE